MACKRCGRCCTTAYMKLDNVPEDDPREIGKWLRYHGCFTQTHDGVLAVGIPIICQHLDFDKKTGEYACKIYDRRPIVCRKYECERCKEAD